MNEPTPTVKVKRDGPRGWRNISQASYDPDVHELFEGEAPVKQDTSDKSDAVEVSEPNAEELGDRVSVPDDWADMHWRQQVGIAKDIIGGDVVAGEGQTLAEKAKAIIEAHIASGPDA